MSLAAETWHVLESRAVMVGIWGRPGSPASLLDVDTIVLLAFLEGIVRETEENSEALNRLYEQAKPKTPQTRAERRAQIERFARLAGGRTS